MRTVIFDPPNAPKARPRFAAQDTLLWGTADAEINVSFSPSSLLKAPELEKKNPYEAWSRSEYSHARFAHYQTFLTCFNLYLPGPFTFILFSLFLPKLSRFLFNFVISAKRVAEWTRGINQVTRLV